MHKTKIGAVALALSLMAGAAFAQAPAAPAAPAAPPPQAPLEIKQVKPGVYMVTGNGGNSTVVVGSTGVIVVDTKNPGRAIYDELNARIKSVTPLPVKEVLITHHHADHSGNSSLYLADGVSVVGHQGYLKSIQTYVNTANPRPVGPSIVYDKELTVSAGGVTAQAHHWGSGHTQGDTVVYFPAQKIVAGGDEVVAVTPNIDYPFAGSFSGWLTSLDAIAKLDFDYVIPGHGNDPISKADFLVYKKKWETFIERARAQVKAGTPKDKLLASIKTDDLGWSIASPNWSAAARLDPFYAELSQ